MKKLYWQEILYLVALLWYYLYSINTYVITGGINVKACGLLNIVEVITIVVLNLLYFNHLIPTLNKPVGLYYAGVHAFFQVCYCFIYFCICEIITTCYFHFGVWFLRLFFCLIHCGCAYFATYSIVFKRVSEDDLKQMSDDLEDLYDDL